MGSPAGRPGRASDPAAELGSRGLVAAEFAVTILAALSLLITLLAGVQLVVVQLRCSDTAAQVARQLARGDEAAARQARATAPAGSDVEVERRGDRISVTVRMAARPLAQALPPVRLTGQAVVLAEPGATAGDGGELR